jgi:AraC-like DNA-binding protein
MDVAEIDVGASAPLERFPLIRTSDVEETRKVLAKVFNIESFELLNDTAGFEAYLNHLQLRHVGIAYFYFNAHARMTLPSDDIVRLMFWIRGDGEFRIGSDRAVLDRQGALVCPAYSNIVVQAGDPQTVSMRFSEPSLRRHLSAVLGVRLNAPVQFSMAGCDGDKCIELLRQFAFDVASFGRTPVIDAHPFMLEEIEQSLLMGLLCGARHNYSHLLVRDPKDIAPWQVRRAMDHIDANWSKPLTVQALASAIGVGARSVFKSFRQSTGRSPMEYVKQVRLGHAREMLMLAEPETTVTGVALVCGFQNAGHFAREYKRAFGELPSITLARAKN